MKNRKKLITVIIILVAVLIIAAIFLYIFMNKNTVEPVQTTADTFVATISDEVLETFKYTESELREIVFDLAKERFGDDAYVIPLNLEGPSKVEIEGTERYVYIYAADSLSKQEDVDNIKGLYHVDPVTGEIFDNGNGKMEKVQLESELNEE